MTLNLVAPARTLLAVVTMCLTLCLSGCATLRGDDPIRMNVVGIEPLAGQGMEMRFNVKLRVQNPNDSAVDFDGIAVELELNDRRFATGVNDMKGSVPRFGEAVISVPVSVSAFAVVRQALGFMDHGAAKDVPYVMYAKLGGPMFMGRRFKETGTLDLPAVNSKAR